MDKKIKKLLLLLLLSFSICQESVLLDKISAVVEGEIVLLSDVVLAANALATQQRINPNTDPEKYKDLLKKSSESMIEQLVIIKMAEADSVEVQSNIIQKVDEFEREYASYQAIASLNYNRNINDEDAKSEYNGIQHYLGLGFSVNVLDVNKISVYSTAGAFIAETSGESNTSIGPLISAGLNYIINDRVKLYSEYKYKHSNFEYDELDGIVKYEFDGEESSLLFGASYRF